MKFGLSQWSTEAPLVIQKIATALLGVATAIGAYGLAASMSIAGYIGLGCVIVGTLLEKLSGKA